MQLKSKKAFSLFEMVLVVVIIGIIYSFVNINFSKLSKKDEAQLNIQNIKTYLRTIEYKETLSLKCIEEAKRCLVFADGELLEELKGIFDSVPAVYSYGGQMSRIDFNRIDMDGYRNFKVDFELVLDKEFRHQDMVVKLEDKVYYLNPMFLKAEEFKYLNEISEDIRIKTDKASYAF